MDPHPRLTYLGLVCLLVYNVIFYLSIQMYSVIFFFALSRQDFLGVPGLVIESSSFFLFIYFLKKKKKN